MYQKFATLYDEIFPFNKKLYQPLLSGKFHSALDLGCATGRLVNYLNQHHIETIGIDLDEKMIKIAKSKYPNGDFRVMNMLYLDDLPRFDLIVCFGNTFPHLHPNDLMEFFNGIDRYLKADGIFWIQLLNYHRIKERHITELPVIKGHAFEFIRRYEILDPYLIFNTTLITNDSKIEGKTTLYPYTPSEFYAMNEHYPFNFELFGSLEEVLLDAENDHYTYVKITKKGRN